MFVQSVQGRLIEENKNLSVERSGENDRRRLETQVQMMENQT